MLRRILFVLLSTFALPLAALAAEPGPLRAYFGTYTGGKSKGIYRGEFDPASGRLTKIALAAETASPSFLAIHGRRLVAVGEIGAFQGKPSGAVSSFLIDAATGDLKPVDRRSSAGAGPCHVSIDPSGRCALVANYGGGSVACLPLGGDGRLGEPASAVQHRGKGPNVGRQEGPHAHSINVDAAGRFAFAADLGLDKILVYRLDAAKALLTPHDPPFAALPPGAGPRHFAFHPAGKFAYAIDELDSTVAAFSYDADRGELTRLQIVSTLPAGFRGTNWPADIHVHPSGKFVYGSNRGHDSLAIFAVDAASGKLTPAGHTPTRGKTPRNFALTPDGRWLLAANQDSDNVAVFGIDAATGALRPEGEPVAVPKPVCIALVKP